MLPEKWSLQLSLYRCKCLSYLNIFIYLCLILMHLFIIFLSSAIFKYLYLYLFIFILSPALETSMQPWQMPTILLHSKTFGYGIFQMTDYTAKPRTLAIATFHLFLQCKTTAQLQWWDASESLKCYITIYYITFCYIIFILYCIMIYYITIYRCRFVIWISTSIINTCNHK